MARDRRERILMGVTDRNERDLLEYVYDTYFARPGRSGR